MPPAAAPAQGGGLIPQWLQSILRFIALYYLGSMIFGKLLGTSGPASTTPAQTVNVTLNNGTTVTRQVTLTNTWSMNTPWNLQVYLSESDNVVGDLLVWNERNFKYNWDDLNTRDKNFTFKTPQNLKNNGTLYAHVIINNEWSSLLSLKTVHSMITYLPKPKPKGLNLMEQVNETKVEEIKKYDKNELVPYWKPTLTINLVVDSASYGPGSVPPEVLAHFNISGDKYSPVIFPNEFWLYREHLLLVNETVDELTVSLSTYPLSAFKWQIYMQMQKSLDMQQSFGGGDESGDDFKRMLTDTNPYLLGLTFVVTMLHTVFEFLAFKNDIAFWKNNKSMEGLSVRTIILHAICQGIVFLYLLDNETSYMILVSCGFGLLVELWKIGKAMTVSFEWRNGLPRINFANKQSYISKTKQYDDMAMKYLSWAIFPLVVGTSIYSLYYHEYKSWYSWVLSSLVRTVYAFEFILMTPQLFINYKLKTVSRLPFKVFIYRALNTVIDDLFAFIIKMPLMHRLSCLRDDIVFVIYLYQRWIYPIDLNRSHYGGEDEPVDGQQQPTIEESKDKKSEKKEQVEDEEEEKVEEQEQEEEEEEKVEEEEQEEKKTVKSSTTIKKRSKKV